MKNIIFLAPPAAGKGTCSDILKNTYDCKHISTGAILRSEIASQSSLGKEIKKIIDAGKLVSDDYMIKLIEETLSKLDKPFILDGFPRTINQAKNLSILFDKLNISNYIVIYLNIDKELALKDLGRQEGEEIGILRGKEEKQLEIAKKHDEAERYSQKGIDYCKKNRRMNGLPQLLYYNAVANSHLGRYELAIERYEQAIVLFKLLDKKKIALAVEEELNDLKCQQS